MDCSEGVVYIYGLVDPRDGKIHYIGKANDVTVRLKQHLRNKDIGLLVVRWLQELNALNLEPDLKVLETTDALGWSEAEKRWIATGRKSGWPLANMTCGGEGWTGDTSYRLELACAAYSKFLGVTIPVEMGSLCRTALVAVQYLRAYFISGEIDFEGCINDMRLAALEK